MMDTKTATVQDLAGEAYSWFERRTRGEGGDEFYALKDGRPDWIYELVYSAHSDGDFLPDDWRYSCIHSALSHIADNDADEDAHEFADSEVDIYTMARFQWLASDLRRASYCDDARADFGTEGGDITSQVGLGQYAEASEVYGLVYAALTEREDELAS